MALLISLLIFIDGYTAVTLLWLSYIMSFFF
jgi:hypothetical protein